MTTVAIRLKRQARPVPVEIIGLSEVPEGGDTFYAVDDEKKARAVVEKRKEKIKEEHIKSRSVVPLTHSLTRLKRAKSKNSILLSKQTFKAPLRPLSSRSPSCRTRKCV